MLDSAQFGFRPGHSMQDALLSMVEEWRVTLDKDKLVGSVFLDLSKAFDMVDHSILLRKLAKYDVVGRELEWFVGYLSGRKQRVCMRDAKNKWLEVQRGVPQGSILGPLLFIVYVNNLPQVIQNSAVTQYADDTKMTLVANDVNSLEKMLDEDLQHVMKWADDNKLKMNTRKTQLMLLSRKRREREMSRVRVSMNKEVIERSRSVKCLGVMLDDGLNRKEHVESVRRKCFTRLAKLMRLRDVLHLKPRSRYIMGWYSLIWTTVRSSGRSVRGN